MSFVYSPTCCPLCESQTLRPLLPSYKLDVETVTFHKHPRIKITLCETCGLVFENPLLDVEQSADTVGATSYPNEEVAREYDLKQIAVNEHRWHTLADKFDWNAIVDALDVGATGAWGAALMDRCPDLRASVVEPSSLAVEHSRRRYPGVKAFCAPFERFDGTDDNYDLITFWYSFNWITRPRAALAKARRLLRPRGRLLICLSHLRFGLELWRDDTPWVNLAHVITGNNLIYYSRRTLAQMLAVEGFRVVDSFVARNWSDDVELGGNMNNRQEYIVIAEPSAAATLPDLRDPAEVALSAEFFSSYVERVSMAGVDWLLANQPVSRVSVLHDGDPLFAEFARALFARHDVPTALYDLSGGAPVQLSGGDVAGHIIVNISNRDIGARQLEASSKHLRVFDCIQPDRNDVYGNWVEGEDGTPIMAKAICPQIDDPASLFPYLQD